MGSTAAPRVAAADEAELPSPLPLFPLPLVLFPGGLLPLKVFEARYLDLMTHCLRTGQPFGVVTLNQGGETRKDGDTVLISSEGNVLTFNGRVPQTAEIAQFEAPVAKRKLH